MARITVEDCIDKFESRFELVLVASNRARRLHSGETPTVEKDNDKNTVIALREIADETISIEDVKNSLIEEYQSVSFQSEEDLLLENNDVEDNNTDQDEVKNIGDELININEESSSNLESEESDTKNTDETLSADQDQTIEDNLQEETN